MALPGVLGRSRHWSLVKTISRSYVDPNDEGSIYKESRRIAAGVSLSWQGANLICHMVVTWSY